MAPPMFHADEGDAGIRKRKKRKLEQAAAAGTRRNVGGGGNTKGRKGNAEKTNPFADRHRGGQKKFSVVGKREKKRVTGSKGRSAKEAEEAQARDGLRAEHARRWKAGGVVDRRIGSAVFGGGGRRASRFALYDDVDEDEDGNNRSLGGMEAELTHLGRSLDDDDRDDDDSGSDRDWFGAEDDDMDYEEEREEQRAITEEFHFGGGFVRAKNNNSNAGDMNSNDHRASQGQVEDEGAENDNGVKTKKQIYEEIMAKSKHYRAQRQLAKEEDELRLQAVDEKFKLYLRDPGFNFVHELSNVKVKDGGKVVGSKRDLATAKGGTASGSGKPNNSVGRQATVLEIESKQREINRDFHAKSAELMGVKESGKAPATDRMLTEEELTARREAEASKEEAKRMRRMVGESGDADGGDEALDDKSGGYGGRRRKQKELDEKAASGQGDGQSDGDDDEGDANNDSGSEESDEDIQQRGGDKPKSFRDIIKSVTKTSGIYKDAGQPGHLTENDDDEDEDEMEEEEEEEEDESGHEETVEGGEGEYGDRKTESLNEMPQSLSERVPEVKVPASYGEFSALLDSQETTDARDQVIRSMYTSLMRVSGAAGQVGDNASRRKSLQELYSMLVQYMVRRAMDGSEIADIDCCFRHLLAWTRLIPLFSGTVALARLERMQARLTEQLADRKGIEIADGDKDSIHNRSSTWPKAHEVVLLRMWTILFPTSDFHHPVLQPTMMFIGHHLSYSPVTSLRDVAVGVFLCNLCSNIVARTRHFIHEPILFLTIVLSTAFDGHDKKNIKLLRTLRRTKKVLPWVGHGSWLRIDGQQEGRTSKKDVSVKELNPLSIEILLTDDDSDSHTGDNVRLSLILSVVKSLSRFMLLYSDLHSFREIFGPALVMVKALGGIDGHASTLLSPAIHDCMMSARLALDRPRPLMSVKSPLPVDGTQRREQSKGTSQNEGTIFPAPFSATEAYVPKSGITMYAPKFEDDFELGKDYDPDIARAERRKLRKTLKKEHRGAAKALRKDSKVLAKEKRTEQNAEREEFEERGRRANKFMQGLESDFRSGGQGGVPKRRRR